MSLLFAEHGIEVNFFDPSKANDKQLHDHAREAKVQDRIFQRNDYKALCESLDSPKVFVFSVPHGAVGDKTVEGLRPYLKKGDIMMDASNELWKDTERRQKLLEPDGVHYIGMGVSGGYQSARHGPSISPGGSKEALDLVMPFLKKVAARDKQGRPCTAEVGPGGSGHYVKMVHNGIEHGMMSTICEIWGIMTECLSMSYEEIADVFERWTKDGNSPLVSINVMVTIGLSTTETWQKVNFLVSIGVDICRTKDPNDGSYVLAKVKDKVVQDVDGTEGTGTWTCQESVRLHVPTPTITTAHMFRLASADQARRLAIKKSMQGGIKPGKIQINDKKTFIQDLRDATYASFLISFVQGLHIITKASRENHWNIDFTRIIQLWRGGCIIQSDHISDLLEKVYARGDHDDDDLLSNREIGSELEKLYPVLKTVVLRGTEADAVIPSLSASLEYLKYSGSTDLPTQFMEAEMDYFGGHMFDLKDAEPGKPVTGEHHFEWKPARGIFDNKT